MTFSASFGSILVKCSCWTWCKYSLVCKSWEYFLNTCYHFTNVYTLYTEDHTTRAHNKVKWHNLKNINVLKNHLYIVCVQMQVIFYYFSLKKNDIQQDFIFDFDSASPVCMHVWITGDIINDAKPLQSVLFQCRRQIRLHVA